MWRREKDGVGAVVWENREKREKVGAVVWEKREKREKGDSVWRMEALHLKKTKVKKNLGQRFQVQGVQSVQGICFWGCNAVRHEYLGSTAVKKQ